MCRVRSGPLLEHLFAQQGEQVLVAAVPVLENDVGGQVDSDEAGDVKPKQVATAARVLQISRNTQVKRFAGFSFRTHRARLCSVT